MKRLIVFFIALALIHGAPQTQAEAARKRTTRRAKRPRKKARKPVRRGARRPVVRRGARRPAVRRRRRRPAPKRRTTRWRRRKPLTAAQRQQAATRRRQLAEKAKQLRKKRREREKQWQERRKSMDARKLFARGSDGPTEGARVSHTGEPSQSFRLTKPFRLLTAVRKPSDKKSKLSLESAQWLKRRKAEFMSSAKRLVPRENLEQLPTKFCVGARCFGNYEEVRNAIYAPGRTRSGNPSLYSPPVFCSPTLTGGQWSTDSVQCTTDWRKTVLPQQGEYPPYACVGHPHFFDQVIDGPQEGSVGGFVCRERVFHVYDYEPIQSAEGKKRAIAGMCKDLRSQVWGRDIAETFTSSTGIAAKDVKIPAKIPLSREELLYFFGNKELYCRADREGLVHRKNNVEAKLALKTGVIIDSQEKWAKSFTCGVPRGVVEAGPFEEGVQLCAVSPHTHDLLYTMRSSAAAAREARSLRKARLHCWKFNRPTCEELALQDEMKKQQKIDTLYKSDVFDFFDAYKELRRTGKLKVLSLKDLKEAEKVPDLSENYAFTDVADDEGTFGIDEFCRFVGDSRNVICGYNRASISHYYELHQQEGGKSSGCDDGVCDRGAFERGYYCALYSMQDYFEGKPVWVCGIDQQGQAGRRMVSKARMVCLGGSYATAFVSPKGHRTTLHCYERKFVWASTARTRPLASFSMRKALGEASLRVQANKGITAYQQFFTSKAKGQFDVGTRKRREKDAAVDTGFNEIKGVLGTLEQEVKKNAAAWVKKMVASIFKRGKRSKFKVGAGDKLIKKIDAAWKKIPKGRLPGRTFIDMLKAKGRLTMELRSSKPNVNSILGLIKQILTTINSSASALNRKRTRDDRRANAAKRTAIKRAKGTAAKTMVRQIKDVQAHIATALGGSPLGFLGHRAASRHFFAKDARPSWLVEMETWARRYYKSTNKKQEKQKDVALKIMEVVSDESVADDRWVQELLLAAKDEQEGYVVDQGILQQSIRQNLLTRMLEGLREITLKRAKAYADAVLAEGARLARTERLTRIELMERAGKEEIFCVEPKSERRLRGTFVCASSPLLVAGEMERYADRVRNLGAWNKYLMRLRSGGLRGRATRRGAKKKAAPRRGKGKLNFKFNFKRKPKRPPKRTTRKRGRRASLPCSLRRAPNGVCAKRKRKSKNVRSLLKRARALAKKRRGARKPARRRAAPRKAVPRKGRRPLFKGLARRGKAKKGRPRLRLGGIFGGLARQMRTWRRERAIDKAKERIRKNYQTRWCYYVSSPTWAKGKSPALSAGYDSPYEVRVPTASTKRGEAPFLWLRCESFKYIDELWQDADRKRWAALHKFDTGEAQKAEADAPVKTGGGGGVNDPRASKHTKKMTSKIGGFLGQMLSMVLPALGKLTKLVDSVKNLGSGFLGQFADKIKGLLENGPWKAAQEAIATFKGAIDKAKDFIETAKNKVEEAKTKVFDRIKDLHAAELAYATAPAPTKKSKEKDKKKAQAELKAAKDAQKDAEKGVKGALKGFLDAQKGMTKGLGKLRGKLSKVSASQILVEMAKKIGEMLSKRIAEAIKPRAAALFKPVFKWVRGILNPIATAVIQTLAAIPFTFGALGFIGQIVYTFALDKLEELAINGLVGLVERFLSKGIRAVLGPVLSAAKPVLIPVVRAACATIPQLAAAGLCSQSSFAALAPKHRWLNRALACKYNAPRITPRMQQRAVAARFEILQKVDDMRENVYAYVRGIANPILARFGYTYDKWMYAFGPKGTEDDRVVAALVAPALLEHVQELIDNPGSLGLEGMPVPAGWPEGRPRNAVATKLRAKVKRAVEATARP